MQSKWWLYVLNLAYLLKWFLSTLAHIPMLWASCPLHHCQCANSCNRCNQLHQQPLDSDIFLSAHGFTELGFPWHGNFIFFLHMPLRTVAMVLFSEFLVWPAVVPSHRAMLTFSYTWSYLCSVPTAKSLVSSYWIGMVSCLCCWAFSYFWNSSIIFH